MRYQLNQLKYAVGLGGMMSFYGIVALVIYLLPPNMVSNQYKIVVIALILLTLPIALIMMFVASRREKKKAKKALEAKEQAAEAAPAAGTAPKIASPAGNYNGLTSGTEEAVQFLKSSNLGSGGKDAVYSLPWYIVAGAPRSGKSSLVMSSNLNFQTLPSQRQSEQKFIRPTGSIDWRVTSDAVFVDTAGRYQTEGIDADEWASLLENLKKYRANRPLDGFLMVVNAETILKGDEREVEELAKVLRARLDEAVQRLKVRFPVYIIFTHADAIEGFRDSFSSSKNEEKTLVWGSTVPLEKSENAQTLFDGEYEILHNSLMKRRLLRLSAPFTPVRQLRIFNFPLHFGSARRKFGSFINSLFRPNPFSENPFLRGFYFTASPVGKPAGNAPPMVGNSYFTERFFRDVILRDKDLVRTFQAQKQKAPLFGWVMTLLGAAVVVSILAMAGVSMITNSQLLQEAEARGQEIIAVAKEDAGKNPLEKNEAAVRNEIITTERSRQLLAQLDENERNGPPWYMGFGLYSGDTVYKKHLLPNYMNVVEARFKGPAIARLEADLRKFASGKPVANPAKPTEAEEKELAKYLDLLKAYLMLSGGEYQEKAQAGLVANALKDYWVSESKTPADMKNVAQQQLEFWAKQIDRNDDEYRFPRIKINDELVAATRTKLQAFPAHFRYLSRKVTEISKDLDDKNIGPTTVEAILSRKATDQNFLVGSHAVPTAYTRTGHDLIKIAIEEANEKLSEDDWVMGDAGKKEISKSTDAAEITDRYYRDYLEHWRSFVKGIDVKPYKNKEEATNALQVFSSPNSPMSILVKEIAMNTNLSAEPEAEGWWEWITKKFSRAKKTEAAVTPPEKEFRPLFDFVGKKDQKDQAPIDTYLTQIGYALDKLRSADDLKAVAEAMAGEKDPLDLKKRENAIANMTKSFSGTNSGSELVSLLQEPLDNLKILLGADLKTQLAKIWAEQILPDAKSIEKGYPFEDSSSEADMTDLTAFLAPGEGKFSKFYDEKLSKYFEEANGQYRVKETSAVQFSDEFTAYLNSAFNLRKALYGGSPTPKFEYEFTLKPAKDAAIDVTIDGQNTTSEGTGSIKGTFPAATASETGVLISVGSGSGTLSPAPVEPSANPSNSNVTTSSRPQSDTGTCAPLRFQGGWGLFRFIDAGSPQKSESGEYALRYPVCGKTVAATVKPSGGDLFDKNIFRQVRAPQNFLK